MKLWAWSLGFLLLWGGNTWAQTILTPSHPADVHPVPVLFNELERSDVIYLGETHDSSADHAAQLQIIQELHRRHSDLAIGMEMFQRPFQPVLDQYLAGQITEAELRQQSEYDQRWGFPWANYAPILRFAQANQIPVLALNTPTEVTRRVAQKGLDALQPSDLQWIPPPSEIRTDNEAYRQFLRPIYEDFHEGHSSSTDFERFFLSQVLWDETMAEQVASFLTSHPDYQMVVLAGQGHVMYGHGIPSRVARRMQSVRPLTQRIVLLNPATDPSTQADDSIADYLWLSTDESAP